MTCGEVMWPGQRAMFTECGLGIENAYHREPQGDSCAILNRPKENMREERAWSRAVKERENIEGSGMMEGSSGR